MEKTFFSLKFVSFKKIWLVLYDSSMRVHTNQGKKNTFLEKVFFGKCFYTFFWHCYEWEDRIREIEKKLLFYRTSIAQKTILFKKTFEKYVIEDQRGTKKWWESFKLIVRKKTLWKASLMRKIFWRTLLSVGVQRTEHWEEKFYLGENVF